MFCQEDELQLAGQRRPSDLSMQVANNAVEIGKERGDEKVGHQGYPSHIA
jgi:hypothetical protein